MTDAKHTSKLQRMFAKLLYNCIKGDINDPTKAFDLLERYGFVDENGDWIYEDD